MSLVFNDTSTYRGIIQKIERNIYGHDGVGRISGNSTLLAQWTADVNLAADRLLFLAAQASGLWQEYDENHSGVMPLYANLVAGQRAYEIREDVNGNLILDFFAVFVKNNGIYSPMETADELTDPGFYDGSDTQGLPQRYAKAGSTILLDPIPSVSVTEGLKLQASIEPSYFTTGDTTKKPGFAGHLHEYLADQPSANYAAVNNLANAVALERKVLKWEDAIALHYSKRARDERDVLEGEPINYL